MKEQPILAISIRQPWAWLILHAGKDIENRSWSTRFRGRVLIHASKGMTRDEYDEVKEWLPMIGRSAAAAHLPEFDQLDRGGIVGEVEIVDCVTAHTSPWFVGEFGFVLKNPKPLAFQPCKGALSFFKPSF